MNGAMGEWNNGQTRQTDLSVLTIDGLRTKQGRVLGGISRKLLCGGIDATQYSIESRVTRRQ